MLLESIRRVLAVVLRFNSSLSTPSMALVSVSEDRKGSFLCYKTKGAGTPIF